MTPQECYEQWDDIEPFIQMALDGQHYKAEDLKENLIKAILRAYRVIDGKTIAVVTAEIIAYPQDKVVLIHTAGGTESSQWRDKVVDMIAEDGRKNGATEIEIIGRKGWLKTLNGFTQKSVIMSKKI